MEHILDLLKAADKQQRRGTNMFWLFYVYKYFKCKYCNFFVL